MLGGAKANVDAYTYAPSESVKGRTRARREAPYSVHE
jgi:hypothetical protein